MENIQSLDKADSSMSLCNKIHSQTGANGLNSDPRVLEPAFWLRSREDPMLDSMLSNTTIKSKEDPVQDSMLSNTTIKSKEDPMLDSMLSNNTIKSREDPMLDSMLSKTTIKSKEDPVQDSMLSNNTMKSREDPMLDSMLSNTTIKSKDDPVQGSIMSNNAINQMTKEQLKEHLCMLHLRTSGIKDVLKKRLKDHFKRQKVAGCNRAKTVAQKLKTKYDYLVVMDFEATCTETNDKFVHEIIEFPAVLVQTDTLRVVSTFQRYCRPVVNSVLSEFCIQLTGISQAQVDEAELFTEVFSDFQDWLRHHKLGSEFKFAVVTDSPWDMAKFLKTQVKLSGLDFPSWGKHWINLRKAFMTFFGCGPANLQQMLADLGMTFQGRPHCGLDDAKNIAAVVVRLLQDGCVLAINEHLYEGSNKPRVSQGGSACRQSGASNLQVKKATLYSIPQEGDNLDDLLEYVRIQKS